MCRAFVSAMCSLPTLVPGRLVMLWRFPIPKGERTNIGRELHGRDRRFRFRAFAIGNRVKCRSVT